MRKSSRKKQTNSDSSISIEPSSNTHGELARASLDANPTGTVLDTITDDGGEAQEKAFESKVWKYATRVGTEKARCKLCLVGKVTKDTWSMFCDRISCLASTTVRWNGLETCELLDRLSWVFSFSITSKDARDWAIRTEFIFSGMRRTHPSVASRNVSSV